MNNASKHDILPPLVAELLDDPVTYIDNMFADGWKRLRFSSLIKVFTWFDLMHTVLAT